jgi:hypothetical protein
MPHQLPGSLYRDLVVNDSRLDNLNWKSDFWMERHIRTHALFGGLYPAAVSKGVRRIEPVDQVAQ